MILQMSNRKKTMMMIVEMIMEVIMEATVVVWREGLHGDA
tara:strand:+ start:335 stop:454 length:120 start_codon:yes stop_codon:yes gene_type:complete